MTRSFSRTYLVTGLALFAMYFGAGNLIFPVMIGAESAGARPAVLAGFLLTGVALPILGMLAVATERPGESGGIASRIGAVPGLVFTLVIFLSTGMLYAIPRVITISYEMSVRPFLPESAAAGPLPLALYAAAFVAIAIVLTINPRRLIDHVGGWLTPALLALLVILITAAAWRLSATGGAPSGEYATHPLPAGLLQGYFTMDALASFVFGVVIIAQLRDRGFAGRRRLLPAMAIVGAITGVGLAAVYVGLALLGNRVADAGVDNGAQALAFAAEALFGRPGVALFGAIAILACLTTAVGLFGAAGQYFARLIPGARYRVVLGVHAVVAFALANLGLDAILAVVAPINQIIYPVAICIIAVALIEAALAIVRPSQLRWTYRLAAWVAAAIALSEALATTGIAAFAPLREVLAGVPGGAFQMAWVLPALAAALIGAVLDARIIAREPVIAS